MNGKILLVEDNELIQQNNKAVLERNGYTVRLAMSLAEARKELAGSLPDAVILDITLPDGNGIDFLKELRRTSQIPVLLLTAMGGTENTAAGLDAGSDDYLAKPYNPVELRARVDALMRRAARVPETVVKGPLSLNPTTGQAFLNGADLTLTQREFALLMFLAQCEGKTISAETIYEKAWGAPMAGDKNTLQATVSALRKKIKASGYGVAGLRGQGYVFGQE
jgi:DNA-binding response OmpR family regulator